MTHRYDMATNINFFNYDDLNEDTERRHYRFITIRKDSEVLWTEEPEQNNNYKYLLLYTKNTAAWDRALREEIINGMKIRFSIYSNGTVMIHYLDREGETTSGEVIQKFINEFSRIKDMVKEYKDDMWSKDLEKVLVNLKIHEDEEKYTLPTNCFFCEHGLNW